MGGYFPFFHDRLMEGSGGGAASGSLAAERSRFERYLELSQKGAEIERRYLEVSPRDFPETRPGERARETFSTLISNLLTSEFRHLNPRQETARPVQIPNVEDYMLIEVPIRLQGDPKELINVMLEMERRGLLINKFSLQQALNTRLTGMLRPAPGAVGTLDMTVARLVPADEDAKRLLRRQKR